MVQSAVLNAEGRGPKLNESKRQKAEGAKVWVCIYQVGGKQEESSAEVPRFIRSAAVSWGKLMYQYAAVCDEPLRINSIQAKCLGGSNISFVV